MTPVHLEAWRGSVKLKNVTFSPEFAQKIEFWAKLRFLHRYVAFKAFKDVPNILEIKFEDIYMMIRNDFGEKKILVKKFFFWLGFQCKILHHNEHVLDKLREKLEKSRSGRLKYCSGVARSFVKRFFDPKYYLEVISWPCVQIISTQTKKLCPPTY